MTQGSSGIACMECKRAIPEDPKRPGQPGMHFCAPDEPLDIDALLEQDARDLAQGQPCRDCGRLAHEHPVVTVLECRDWR